MRLPWLAIVAITSGAYGAEQHFQLGDGSFRASVVIHDDKLRDKYGPRFDPVSVISVQRGSLEFLAEEGLIDEFNTRSTPPPGYDRGLGNDFLKIGVGILRRMRITPYRFWDPYPLLQPAQITIRDQSATSITVEQSLDYGPWAYLYRKTFSVDSGAGRVVVDYTFTNRSAASISFDQYNHNWLLMEPASRERPWLLRTSLQLSLQGLITSEMTPHSIRLCASPSSAIYLMSAQTAASSKSWVHCMDGRRSVVITANFPAARFSVFAQGNSLAPEVFADFTLSPGRTISWQRSYTFQETALEYAVPSPMSARPPHLWWQSARTHRRPPTADE